MTPAQVATNECLDIMAEAKSLLVKMDGIGAELLPALLAWDDDGTPIGYVMVQNPHATLTDVRKTLTKAAGLMVVGWHAAALAITTESYVRPMTTTNPSTTPPTHSHPSSAHPTTHDDATNTIERTTHPTHAARHTPPDDDLRAQYPTDPTIDEALWVAYAHINGDRNMGIRTMHQQVGRLVTYGETVHSEPTQHEAFATPGTLQHCLAVALALPRLALPDGHTIHEGRQRIATELHQLGLTVYLDNPTT